MKISNIKIQRIEDENNAVKATVTVTFGDYIVVRDIKIVKAPQSTFIAMPAIKVPTGEFKDICHPITVEFRDYMQKNVLDVFNSGETEKSFEDEFSIPKIDIRIRPVLDDKLILGVCDLKFDDEFVIHNIIIIKTNEGMTVAFPYRKTPTDDTIPICKLINNEERYCNQIIDAYIKMTEENSRKLNTNTENNNKIESDDASGWNAITAEAERVYPGQKDPKHYGTIIAYRLGGNDPLDGISIYDGGDYWHFVTYGLSELYEKRTDNKEISGYGMEFTLKLKKDNYEDEEKELKNICAILQAFARSTFSRNELFNEYEYIVYSGEAYGIDVNRKSNLTGFITIPDNNFKPIDTPNGKVKFVEFIGVTDDELKAIMDKRIKTKELYEMLESDITDYHRKSVFENTGDKVDVNKPVENPELKRLIDKYSNSQDDSKNEVIEIILQKIAEESKLLSIVMFSQQPTQKDNGMSTIESGTQMGFPTVTYKDGKYRYFPAYTDWTELRKNPSADKEPRAMIFGFDNYATLVLDQSDDDGLVINPYSEHPFFLSRKQMEHIRNVKNNNTTKKINDDENTTQKHSEALVSNFISSISELKAFPFEAEGYPRFIFYFPKDLGEVEKPYSNVFEIIKDKVQKIRVMVSKCTSFDNFKSDTKKWIEKNKSDAKMEDVAYRNETVNDISIEVYELKYIEHPDWPHKIYKVGFVDGYRVTISGWLAKGREEIINQAFEKLTIDES